jgi:multiple sugar transport system substrate-binding protein
MQMKKLTLLILLVASMILSACGGGGTNGPVTISYMVWGAPEELAVWQQIVDDFQAGNPNIKVNVEVSDWDSYWEKLKTLLAASTPPDVFAMDAPLYLDYQSRGVLLNLQPYLDKSPGMLDEFYPVTLEAYNLPDGYYGLPRDFQTVVLFYNKDMFDSAQVPYPTADWTYDDLRSAAMKLTVDKNGDGITDQYGFYSDLWDMELVWSEAIWSWGGDVINADHTKTMINEPAALQAWQYFYDMIFTDKSMPDLNTSGQYGGDPFQSGVVAMTTIGHWAVPGYATADFKWDVAPMPVSPTGGRSTSVNSAGFVIAKDSKYPDASWEFVKYCLSEAGQTRLAELGLAIPVLKSVANSPVFLNQTMVDINQQVFLDSLDFAKMKPVVKGYDEWSAVIGDGMGSIWRGETELNSTLETVVVDADAVLASNQ